MDSLIFFIFWVLFSCASIHRSIGCIEEERIGLLKLKEAFNNRDGSAPSAFSSWDGQETDCCQWNNVECDFTTRRVVQLSLNRTKYEILARNVDSWSLDLSLFLPFKQLRNLSLSWNRISGLHGELRSNKLQMLDVSFNWFEDIPPLATLQSLKKLNLESVHLNNLSNFRELTNLGALETLNMAYTKISGQIPSSIWDMTSLKAITFRGDKLHGPLSGEGLCKLKNLQELDLSHNNLQGPIPSCISSLTNLRVLDISENLFSGKIPLNLFSNLQSLEYVSLSYNHFEGAVLFSSFGNNSKLQVFELDSHNNKLNVETESPHWKPFFQLKVFRLTNCVLNKANRILPSFLWNQYDLRVVNLSHNGMMGEGLAWLIKNNSKLELLSLRNNFLTGSFSLDPETRNLDMFWLDISGNRIQGEIPTFSSIMPNLLFLNMSNNAFQGSIPVSLGDLGKLKSLDLSNNKLSGEIQEHLVMGCTSLRFLKLSHNILQGHLLPKNSNLTKLWALYLDNNHFSGELSQGLNNSRYLQWLNIGNNSISGKFPDWINDFQFLSTLVLSRNSLEGTLPESFCKLQKLSFLDLSYNNLNGTFPTCGNISYLRYLHIQGNQFNGPIPHVPSALSSLVTLDIRDNKFSGEVPSWLSSFSSLRVLLFKGNSLEGSIPQQLCQMRNLSILDLSSNNFSGMIPACLSIIPFGAAHPSDETFQRRELGWTTYRSFRTYSYECEVDINQYVQADYYISDVEEEYQFISKSRLESYSGNILYYMSGVDFSNNKLTGPIPEQLGYMNNIHTLNLSHNCLHGRIPPTFSNLKEIQSLDLSHNNLSGEIPQELIQLNFLSAFSVAWNNLSGRVPDRKAQFATFDWSSFEGNPLLHGPQPERGSTRARESLPSPPQQPKMEVEESDSFMDSFWWGFVGSYIGAFIGLISFLCFYFYSLPR